MSKKYIFWFVLDVSFYFFIPLYLVYGCVQPNRTGLDINEVVSKSNLEDLISFHKFFRIFLFCGVQWDFSDVK